MKRKLIAFPLILGLATTLTACPPADQTPGDDFTTPTPVTPGEVPPATPGEVPPATPGEVPPATP